MRYEKLMALLKFAEKEPMVKIVGDWVYTENAQRGPLVQTVEEGITECFVELDPLGRLCLTDMGYRRFHKVGGNARIVVMVPKEREAEFRKMLVDFFRRG